MVTLDAETLGVSLLAGAGGYLIHDRAHQFYGTNAEAVGNVGTVVLAMSALGVALVMGLF